MQTPWGTADTVKKLDDGIVHVTTPSHGGVFIPPKMLKQIPGPFFAGKGFALQRCEGWFEEDCDMSIAIAFFPEHFRRANLFGDFDKTYKTAVQSMNFWHADAVEQCLEN